MHKFEVYMENKSTELRLELEEIKSCMIILQKAIENECDEIEPTDVSNYLEITIEKIKNVITTFDKEKEQ